MDVIPLITYPAGSTEERTRVLAVASRDGGGLDLVVERTPCHPESPRWPDQPADEATLTAGEQTVAVTCSEGGLLPDGGIVVGVELPEDAVACVVHHVEGLALAVGDELGLRVDEQRRAALSRHHSVCHFAALALNRVLAEAGAWRKDPGRHDALGAPDFDALAITASTIRLDGSDDRYRVSKSLRKKGVVADALAELEPLERAVGETLAGWLAARPAVAVGPGECRLDERRTWSSTAADVPVTFACGGTHATSVGPEDLPTVTLERDEESGAITMRLRPAA